MNPAKWEEEFVEKGADLEHKRWAGWQKYLHSKGHEATGYFLIPMDAIERWERQIATPYAELSEKEKESDRKEVRQYLPLIKELLSAQQASLRERLESERREKPKDGWFKYCGCDGECFAACDRSFNTGIDAAIALLDV